MIMSSVVDPSAFNKSYFSKPGYREQAEMFFRGISDNGLLIVDKDLILQKKLIEKVNSLPLKIGQQLQIRMVDLLKDRKKKIVYLSNTNISKKNLLELVYNVKTRGRADCLVISDRNLARLKKAGVKDNDLILLSNYLHSEFEDKRHHYIDQLPPIDQISKDEVDKLIIRTVKYSKWLRFFDKQMGKGIALSNFQRGISYILTLWKKEGYFASNDLVDSVEIITCYSNDNTARARIENRLIKPLKEKYQWEICLLLKKNLRGFPHPRYLQTEQGVFLFERGFDFVKPNGNFKTCEIRISNQSYSILQKVLEMPECNMPEPPGQIHDYSNIDRSTS